MFEQTRIEPNGTFWSTNLGNLALCSRGNLALCHGFDSGLVSGTLVVAHSYLEDWLAQFKEQNGGLTQSFHFLDQDQENILCLWRRKKRPFV